jgi:hypothetical protein
MERFEGRILFRKSAADAERTVTASAGKTIDVKAVRKQQQSSAR